MAHQHDAQTEQQDAHHIDPDPDQLKRALKDIQSIKSVISKCRPAIQALLLPGHFTIISYISGIGISLLSLAYYFLILGYGSYGAIPEIIRTALLITIGILAVTVWILKGVLWFRSAHTVAGDLSFGQMLRILYSGQILHTWIPITLLMGFFSLYLWQAGMARFIPGVAALGVGIVYNLIGGMVRIWQYLLTGYWLILTGAASMVVPQVPPLIWLALTLGAGLLIFARTSRMPLKDRGLDNG